MTRTFYPRLLGAQWAQLDPAAQHLLAANAPLLARGQLCVRRGRGWLARAVALFARFPEAGHHVPLTLKITETAGGERWIRSFAGTLMSTAQTITRNGKLSERVGWLAFDFRVQLSHGRLNFDFCGAALALGRWRISLPRWLSPALKGRNSVRHGRVHIGVAIWAPTGDLLIAYSGEIETT